MSATIDGTDLFTSDFGQPSNGELDDLLRLSGSGPKDDEVSNVRSKLQKTAEQGEARRETSTRDVQMYEISRESKRDSVPADTLEQLRAAYAVKKQRPQCNPSPSVQAHDSRGLLCAPEHGRPGTQHPRGEQNGRLPLGEPARPQVQAQSQQPAYAVQANLQGAPVQAGPQRVHAYPPDVQTRTSGSIPAHSSAQGRLPSDPRARSSRPEPKPWQPRRTPERQPMHAPASIVAAATSPPRVQRRLAFSLKEELTPSQVSAAAEDDGEAVESDREQSRS